MSFCVRYLRWESSYEQTFSRCWKQEATKQVRRENQHAEWPGEKIKCLRATEKESTITSVKSQHFCQEKAEWRGAAKQMHTSCWRKLSFTLFPIVTLILLNYFYSSSSACWKNSEKRTGTLEGKTESMKDLRHRLWQYNIWKSQSSLVILAMSFQQEIVFFTYNVQTVQ